MPGSPTVLVDGPYSAPAQNWKVRSALVAGGVKLQLKMLALEPDAHSPHCWELNLCRDASFCGLLLVLHRLNFGRPAQTTSPCTHLLGLVPVPQVDSLPGLDPSQNPTSTLP